MAILNGLKGKTERKYASCNRTEYWAGVEKSGDWSLRLKTLLPIKISIGVMG
jgi:hypothetical protein